MRAKNPDLHGSAPDQSDAVLILIDVINDLDFDGSDDLLRAAVPMADRIADLKRRAKAAGLPVVYVNDNFGRWQSNFTKIVDHALGPESKGRPIVERLRPDDDDYFVLKPKHSGFFSTSLDILLDYLGAETLILAGVAGNICVLFTANEAYMRDFSLVVPADCVASNTEEENRVALDQIARVLKADTRPSVECRPSRSPDPPDVPTVPAPSPPRLGPPRPVSLSGDDGIDPTGGACRASVDDGGIRLHRVLGRPGAPRRGA